MAHTLTITSDAITDISLTTGDLDLLDYTPQDSGGQIVTESALVSVKGTAVTDIQTSIENIKKAFELANRRFDRGHGDRVYIKFQPNGASAAYRSELVRPRVDASAGVIGYMGDVLGGKWAAKDLDVELTWTRKNYWEKNAEAELSISNGGGSGTGGQTIYNIHGSATISASTGISFAAANNRVSDSGNNMGSFAAGDIISVRGSTDNNGIFSVEAVGSTGDYLDINEDVLSDEAAGDSVSIYDIQNYVHIDSANIDGDLPTAVRLEVTNSDSSGSLETAWIAQNIISVSEQFPHILEIDDSDTGTSTGDATSSSGFKRSYSIGTSEAKVTGWSLNSEMLAAAGGGYFKTFARFAQSTGVVSVKWRLKLLYSGTTIWEGEQVEFDDTNAAIARLIRAIDTVQLPPYVPENSVPTALTLELWGESTTGGNVTVDIDCLVLMTLDGYRRMRSLGGVAFNSVLIDDGVTDTYYQEVSSEQVRDIAVTGMQLMIDPSNDNRIYFLLHSATANTADYDRDATVKIYYRPRKSSI